MFDQVDKGNNELKTKQYIIDKIQLAYEQNTHSLIQLTRDIERAQNTKAWKVMCVLRRLNEQFIKGEKSEKRKFVKWIYNKISGKPIVKDLELSKFNPFENVKDIVKIDSLELEYEADQLFPVSSVSNYENEMLNIDYYYFDVFRFPVIEWDFRWQRPQQISVQFAENGHRVFYFSIDTADLNNPNLTREEVEKQVSIKKLHNNVWGVKLCSNNRLNAYRDVIGDPIDLKYLNWSIDHIKNKFKISNTISILDLPFWSDLAHTLTNNKIIYDCMDEHEGFSTNSAGMLSKEEVLIRSSDMVVTSSSKLFEKAILKNSNTILIRNAGEYEHFSSKTEQIPLELSTLKGPIIGYYGAISDWFDIKLIEYLAKRNADWNFILIGDTFGCDITEVSNLKNVILTGEKPYTQLPQYLNCFDVCIIPFLVNNLTLATNPVKIYEYLAAGKPVVSVKLPELELISNVVGLASNYEEFESLIQVSLKTNDQSLIDKRKTFASLNTWLNRYEVFKDEINQRFFPKVSIIIITYNNWPYTKQCLQSLLGNNDYPNLEVIIVDNASTDETKAQLSRVNDPRVSVLYSSVNLGFAGGNALGCKNSTGEFIILLNNDTIVTQGWIQKLIKPLRENLEIGLAGPVSNSVGNDQMLDFFVGDSLSGADPEWLAEFYAQYKGRIRYTNLLGFFCVAFRRDVYNKIGDLDSNYKIGMFEDDDYCERVRNNGYKLAIIEDAFVYHHGSVSFKKLEDKKYREIWEFNKNYFEQKWSKTWTFPNPPDSIFSGVHDSSEIGKYIKEQNKKNILIVGDGIWNNDEKRSKKITKHLGGDDELLIVNFVTSYHNTNISGIRKYGPNIYFTNRIDFFESVVFDAIIYCGSTLLDQMKAHRVILDELSYSNSETYMKLKTYNKQVTMFNSEDINGILN
ncbi:glycosyltransferase [Paenibacillus sp. 5J-6]|uniref:Glycosyltransferase n=1 Tax=Paenibacillus silvestris TaxID=2606219 RepID=A0A6L8UZV4_9BACL|nr:glycosyltransferase [Paenibacillus silvestris]MZQ83733.1 glycosyltransferase [Paenibacillus silvestris]